jgi:ArsR family transcriptional regulator
MKNRRNDSEGCVHKLKALADPTRLAVVEALMDGPRHVGELGDLLDVEQSLLSHHLRVLRDIGLLTAERDGKAVLYSLAPGVEGSAADRSIELGCCELSFPSPRSHSQR